MILEWLDDDLNDLFARNPNVRVVLWFDEKEEFARLLDDDKFPPETARYTLLRYDEEANHGQLWLKAQIVWESRDLPQAERDELRWVLYLPFGRDALEVPTGEPGSLEYLLEYKYRGREWLVDGHQPTLFRFLRSHGVPLPDSPKQQRALWEGGRESRLAKYVAKFCDRDEEFWAEPLTEELVRERILGDLEEHLLTVLADPEHAAQYLAEKDLLAEFQDEVSEQFGYEGDMQADPSGWVDRFSIRLAMTECFEGYGRPADFPFLAIVADEKQRERCVGFLDKWLHHSDYAPVYQKLITRLESDYSLASWVSDKPGSCQSLLHLAEIRWRGFYEEFCEVAGSREESAALLDEARDQIQGEANSYWCRVARVVPGWQVAGDLAAMVANATQAESEAQECSTLEQFVDAYSERWHSVDRGYWEVLVGTRRHGGLEQLLRTAHLHYGHYLNSVNMLFQDALRKSEEPREALALTASDEVWKTQGMLAVIVVDALRYDLAARLSEQLAGAEAACEPWLASTPSITCVGMSSLLPLAEEDVSVSATGNTFEVGHATYGDLCVKANRSKLLVEELGAHIVELSDLWQASEPPGTEEAPLVVYTREIDAVGHATGLEVASHFDELLGHITATIEKLQRWGYTRVHVVTDHGFILLADNAQPPADAPPSDVGGDRYALPAEGASTDLLVLPMTLDDSMRVAFAPGFSCFGRSPYYVHGGASLQEMVIPHITVRAEQPREKVRFEVSVRTNEVATLTFKVTLKPEVARLHLFAEEPQPRRVEVFVSRGEEVVSAKKEVLVDPSARKGIDVTLFLDDSAGLRKGDQLQLRGIDMETAEELVQGYRLTVIRDI